MALTELVELDILRRETCQGGTVVRLGENYGAATPVSSFVYNSVLSIEIKA